MTRETMEYDLLIVGAGPAGLAAAIRFKQLCLQQQKNYSVCVLEKGSEVGAHILSGNVFEPRALDELIPDWKNLGAPLSTPVTEDHFYFLTEKKSFRLPLPKTMHNHGNYVISLGLLCRWLATQAESLGVEIYPGFPAKEFVFDEQGEVKGVIVGDVGIDKSGNPTAHHQPGMILRAKQTLLAEGCRGSLSKIITEKFDLNQNNDPQTYAIGIKELWEVDPAQHHPGRVIHSLGWPMDQKTYGGGFIYHLDHHQVYVGLVIGLDYQNTYLNPFKEMQRFKTHPAFRSLFKNGKRITYGARALNEGGWQAIPSLTFPGGMLIGCSAGFLNVAKIKGSHTAMKSGMLAAESVYEQFEKKIAPSYPEKIKQSWIATELKAARNIRPGFRFGLLPGMINAGFETLISKGKSPWTLSTHNDYSQLKPANVCQKITYAKPDGLVTFDLPSSVYLSNTNHEENQPCHLQLKNPTLAIDVNFKIYDSPESRYCPAGVYEIVQKEGKPHLQINAQNCIHCKTCDIKDPKQNINWIPPEGGGGPNYPNM